MNTFSTSGAIKQGWQLFKSHKGLLVLIGFISLILGGITSGKNGQHIPLLATLVLFAVSLFIKAGIQKLYLKLTDGIPTDWKEIFMHGELFLGYAGTTILYFIGVFIGIILLVIPGIYIALKYIFAPILVVDKGMKIGEAFKKSAEMTKGHKLDLLLFAIMLGLVNLLGLLCLVVGLLVSVPVSGLAFVQVYRSLLGSSAAAPQPTPAEPQTASL